MGGSEGGGFSLCCRDPLVAPHSPSSNVVDVSAGPCWVLESRQIQTSDSRDVGGEKMNPVSVEIPLACRSALSFEGLSVARICASRSGAPTSSALVIAAWRSECGLMCREMSAAFAIRYTIRSMSRRSTGLPLNGRRTKGPWVRSPRQASRRPNRQCPRRLSPTSE